MSSHDELPGTCKFGHTFHVHDLDGVGEAGAAPGLRDQIINDEITSLREFKEAAGTELLRPAMGDPYKHLEVGANSQGLPHMFILDAADRFDDNWDWTVHKTEEKIFVSPQSNMHAEFMQRKQQAEQNIKNTMQNLTQLKKQKHMLEHDIRKLRQRAEALGTGDETQIKGDFIELVDGAGASGQQGGDEASLKFYRDNNIYPSIVADFNEMDSLDDLKSKDDGGTGKLAELPENLKAILKKKYTMYEKWKDLYGSEVQRKLNDLKGQLRSIKTSIEETESWLEPYARDMVMIHQKNRDDYEEDLTRYWTFKGHSTQQKSIEFIAYQEYKNEHGSLQKCDEGEETHYKIVYLHCIHLNIAGAENPNTPAEGPTVGVVFVFPAVVCKHVFENIFQEKIERSHNRLDDLVSGYTGEFDSSEGDEFKNTREGKEISIRSLRDQVDEKIDERVPLEFSSLIRRIEDGIESPTAISEEYGEEYLEAVNEILDTSYGEADDDDGPTPYEGMKKTIKEFTGQYDAFHLEDVDGELYDLKNNLKFKYYYDMKISLGLYTMK